MQNMMIVRNIQKYVKSVAKLSPSFCQVLKIVMGFLRISALFRKIAQYFPCDQTIVPINFSTMIETHFLLRSFGG